MAPIPRSQRAAQEKGPYMADENQTLLLSDDEGETTEFDLLDTIDYQGQRYIVVAPRDEEDLEGEGDEEDEAPAVGGNAFGGPREQDDYADEDLDPELDLGPVEVVVLRATLTDDGGEEYEAVDDDATLEALFGLFQDRHADEYDFE